jgi:hypothetical protein
MFACASWSALRLMPETKGLRQLAVTLHALTAGKDISIHPIAFDLNQYASLEDKRFSAGFASNPWCESPFEGMN